MKQRIRVAGIVKRGEEVLLLERATGRAEAASTYELPVGKISYGEQPEEAMARIIYDYLGVRARGVKLADAVTFIGLRGASELANLYIVYEVDFEDDSVIITTERYSSHRWVGDGDFSKLVLEEASLSVLEIAGGKLKGVVKNTEYRGENYEYTIYVDGGSRGNPGPSGVGYYVLAPNGDVMKRGGEFIGFSTSRVAEYYALKEGIEQAIELGLKSVQFKSDSLMLVNHMNGVYAVKNKDLMPIYESIWKLLGNLNSYSFIHVPREGNVEADREVNIVIDEHYKKN